MSGENRSHEVMLFAVHSDDASVGFACCIMLLKMKRFHNLHVHVTAICQDDEYLSDIFVIKELNRRLFLHETDVTCDQSVQSAVNKVIEIEGKIDYLVCDIEQRCCGTAIKTTPHFMKQLFDINFYSHVRFITNVVPFMKKIQTRDGEGGGGRIIVFNSYAGIQGITHSEAYSSSRFALNGFLQSVAAEVYANKIRVSIVHTVIRKPFERISKHAGICFDNHQQLSQFDQDVILRKRDELTNSKLYKSISIEKLSKAIKVILLNDTVASDLNFFLNKSCKQAAEQKFLDVKGTKTLTEVVKVFLNVADDEIDGDDDLGEKQKSKFQTFIEKRKTCSLNLGRTDSPTIPT